ncbi:TIM barrel protein [Puniceicoccaceae bacterium K14]|nr:TIM barrel protein [Puniceicoccaceae bacterium K14]
MELVFKARSQLIWVFVLASLFVCRTSFASAPQKELIEVEDYFPWCIVAYDSLERTPTQRIKMIQKLGFQRYAYDWRDRHLDDTLEELQLATEHGIEVIGVWLWLNAERDRAGKLGDGNQRLIESVKASGIQTTLWVGLSPNFFEGLTDEQSFAKAIELIDFVSKSAASIGCRVALYNHTGWFANPYNQIELIEALPEHKLQIVYNFHHGHQWVDHFDEIANAISPYLVAVNLNGMDNNGTKISPIGQGKFEYQMIESLIHAGFNGPWGIMGHMKNTDVKEVLIQNLKGLKQLSSR